jgi:hypothetical protein
MTTRATKEFMNAREKVYAREENFLKTVIAQNKVKKSTINKIIFLLLNDPEKYSLELTGLFSILDFNEYYASPHHTAKIIQKYLRGNIKFEKPTQKDYWRLRFKNLVSMNGVHVESINEIYEYLKDCRFIWQENLKDEKKSDKLYNMRKEIRKFFGVLSTKTLDELKYSKEIFMLYKYWTENNENNFYNEYIKPTQDLLEGKQ